MKSENKNFLLNVAYQMLMYIFPLISVSYVSKRLGVDNVGIYSYTYSVVYLFMLVGMLGINNYGNREIAKIRDDEVKCSATFISIYRLQLTVTGLVMLGYAIYIFFWCKRYKNIACIQALYLLSVCFDVNWFYFGLEKFKLTITRNCIIKVISLILILCFVKTQDHLARYTFIMAGSTVASQVYLVLLLHKYVTYAKESWRSSYRHLKSCLLLFIPVIAFGIYRVMDKTMLGSLSTVTELGYYENAERLINIPISVITALGTVMLPRMSYVLRDKSADFKKPIFESMKLALLLACIMGGGLYLISNDIVIVLFGDAFYPSGMIIRLLSVTVIASAWANVIRTQFLIPKGMDNVYVFSTVGGAAVNLVFNLLLIGRFGATGACVGTIAAEVFVMIFQTVAVNKQLEIKRYLKVLGVDIIKTSATLLLAFACGRQVQDIYGRLAVEIFISMIGTIVLYYKFIVYEFLGVKKV